MAVYRRLQDKYSAYNEAVEAAKPVGALYKVDLPDNLIARMLDWDKPLSQQAPEVQRALAPENQKNNWRWKP